MAVSQPKKNNVERSDFSKPNDVRSFERGHVELVTLGGVTFGRATFNPGWRWSQHIKPIANTPSCEQSHTVYAISGHMHIVMDDGTEIDFHPGDVGVIPPGHDGWVVGNDSFVCIDVSGMENYAKQIKAA